MRPLPDFGSSSFPPCRGEKRAGKELREKSVRILKKLFDNSATIHYNTNRVIARYVMLLDVRPLLRTPGKRLDFQFEMDLSDVEFAGRYPVSRPVLVEGQVRNTADILSLDMTARSTLDAVCDRCGKEFLLEKEVSFSCALSDEVQNEDNLDIVLLEEGSVDVGDLARTEFILEMDIQTLCSEDCKGLCSRCGADLNLGPCSCKKEVDPRLAALAKLLENK